MGSLRSREPWHVLGHDFSSTGCEATLLYNQINDMDEAQFQLAIEELAQKFQTLKHTAQLQDCDWQDVTLIRSHNLPSSLNHFLRLTRRLPLRSKEKKKPPDTTPQQHQVPEAQEAQSQIINNEQATEEEEEEEDPECLPKFPPTTTHPSTDPTTTIIYDIIYSPTYRVPVLYIHKPPPPAITPPDDDNNDDDDDNDNDNPDPFLTHLQNSSSSAVLLSLIDHPTTGKPVYFIHPCRTQEAIAEILSSSSSSSSSTRRLGQNGSGGGEEEEEEERGGGEGGMQWFMAWWGCIGNSAGLSVPMELARMVMMPTLTTTKTMSTAGGV